MPNKIQEGIFNELKSAIKDNNFQKIKKILESSGSGNIQQVLKKKYFLVIAANYYPVSAKLLWNKADRETRDF